MDNERKPKRWEKNWAPDIRYIKKPLQVAVSEEGIRNDIREGEKMTDISLASKLIQLEPFLTKKVVERLRNVEARSLKSDIDDILQIDQPNTIKVATLRDYQLRGVSWLVDRYDKGINCILADEMGLGKTLQTITFFAHLKDIRKIPGPHLVVVPLSILFNWMSECRKFCPSLRLIR
jgi:SWI/SNF-related matrix-associated actin-dependent regulator of chromatin subfamily A member 5